MADGANRREWTVTGMDCASCTAKITRAVERLPGVSDVRVALMAERLTAHLAPGTTDPAKIEDTVRRLGFGIAPAPQTVTQTAPQEKPAMLPADAPAKKEHNHGGDHDHEHEHGDAPSPPAASLPPDPADPDRRWYRTAKGRLVILTAALLAVAWAVELLAGPGLGYWAFLLACLIGVAPVAKRALAALRTGQPFTIESLMTIAVLGALLIGAVEEAAVVVFLFAVGEVLEGVAADRARSGIRALAALVPKVALLETPSGLREVEAGTLTIGQIVLVRPGDRIPADGEIIEGTSGIDESPVTGESVPRTKGPKEQVFAGTINVEAALRLRVTQAASDNTIARIVRLVEEAEEARAPTERFIDRFSRWYMPLIVGIAALVMVLPPLLAGADWSTWVYRGLAILLIGCPCALVISVPASIASALSAGARRGLLMKGGAVIEAAATLSHAAFDKTGTLTRGAPVVTDVVPAPGVSEEDLLTVAAGVESGSSHPLAQAILARAGASGLVPRPSAEARAIPGKGAVARVDGVETWVSSPRYAAEMTGVADPGRATALEAEGKTVVAVFRSGQPLGLLALRDEPRPDAAEGMRQLRALGIDATMLTGDNPRTAAAIAGELGMDFRAEMLPEDKLAAIREMQAAGGVMMIGDGINDAPALKQAGVGVAMGSGTDVALETADAAILRDRVADVAAMVRLARGAMRNIHQNIALALGLKAVFLVTSTLGITGLWLAILADTGATVLVTLNALRLLRFNPER
ncbi:heavy metal translocating P-type ATPase [Haematobacter genomosp. 1]|uniref:P-type Zn(2+) transporter n=1 Tax=Haematobacter genomosp. 1 TaxID=366618 RepID=A0A212AAR0_9RHOB|nr:heavy metal translocating P-type ATPase [Haematobacter genomosp. 1]OWJ77291.1 heavy metal translocating P-type ATPase [Haematobacter genomosp. 1]